MNSDDFAIFDIRYVQKKRKSFVCVDGLFDGRFGEERALLEVALKSTALKDGLSGPLTIVYLIYQHIARLTNNDCLLYTSDAADE